MRIFDKIIRFLGYTTLTIIIVGFFISQYAFFSTRVMPPKVILNITVDGRLDDYHQVDSVEELVLGGTMRPSLYETLRAIQYAKDDDRVHGILLDIHSMELSSAQVQELREAIEDFQGTKKFVYAYADTFGLGNVRGGLKAYYLAVVANQVFMQPGGSVALTSLGFDMPFMRKVLDKWKIKPYAEKRAEYKSFLDMLLHDDITPPVRENYTALLQDLESQITRDIAKDLDIPVTDLKKHMDQAPLSDKQALEAKLIDALIPRAAVINKIEKMQITNKTLSSIEKASEMVFGGDRTTDTIKPKFLGPLDYLARLDDPKSPYRADIAVIFASGTIYDDLPGKPHAFSVRESVGGYALTRQIDRALDKAETKAIVLRINSPGGSPTASETIWQALQKAHARKVPVVISMGEVAASGGYYIATAGDWVQAMPATMTGSIGVIMPWVFLKDFWSDLGVAWAHIGAGETSNFGSTIIEADDFKRAMKRAADATYALFIEHVAKGRKLTPDATEAVAKGRVWTGLQAWDKKLVDQMGGLLSAIEKAKVLSKMPKDTPFDIVEYPRPMSVADLLIQVIEGETSLADISILSQVMAMIRGAWTRLVRLQVPNPV